MLNCIIATMRPKSGMKRPSTPASFIRRSTTSGELRDVRISQEQPIGLGVLAQFRVDQLQRWGHRTLGVRMDREVAAVGEPEETDEIDGIALENVPAPAH